MSILKSLNDKMKKLLIAYAFFCLLVCHSCTVFLAPSYAEEDDILIDVYNQTDEICFGKYYLTFHLFGIGNVSQSEKIDRVEMLEWCLNEAVQGNSYTGYYITYSVKLGDDNWYALVDLTEFDSGRYEWRVLDADRSLSAIQSLLY